MKTFKKTLCLVLAVCMLASMAVIAASAVEDTSTATRPVVSEVVNSDPEIPVDTYRYYFYMPENWKNEKNDNYDGSSLDSCAAGIYWWSTSYNAEDYKGECAQGWPGFRILDQDPDCPNVFYCDVPTDCGTVIFNNTVDGGQDETAPGWGFNAQTVDAKTAYTSDADDYYGFYTGMTDENPMTFNNMIYVVNPLDTTVNEFSGATTTRGDWFYYYGNGEYGTTPEKGDAVFNNGDFPSSFLIETTGTVLYPNEEKTISIKTNSPASELTVASDNAAVTVGDVKEVTGDAKWKSEVKITGVSEGDATVTFTRTTVDAEAGTEAKAIRTCAVTVSYMRPRVDASNKTITVGKTANPFKVSYGMTTTYNSNKTSVATVDKNGKVTGKAAGKATITCTTKAGSYTVTETATVTVKKAANTMTVKAKAVTAKANKKVSIAAKKYAVVSKAVGKVTYKKASGDKKVTVSSKGVMTVNKLKKGKYTVKVKVTAAGNAKTAAGSKTIAVKVTVK